jgi:hypothetical protein
LHSAVRLPIPVRSKTATLLWPTISSRRAETSWPLPWTKPLAALPCRVLASPAVSAWPAVPALPALVAYEALGTLPRVETLMSDPVREPSLTLSPVIASAFIFTPAIEDITLA